MAVYDRPPHGFLDDAGVQELEALVRRADRDPEIGAVVLTGARSASGSHFITHFDVAELTELAETRAPRLGPRMAHLAAWAGLILTATGAGRAVAARSGPVGRSLVTLSRLHRIIRDMHASSVVWIAAINGPCLGGGLEMALNCDIRIASDSPDVRFGQPEILGGILPGAGGTQNLTRMLGTARAVHLLLDGGQLSAEEALAAGLVSSVVPDDELAAVAEGLAHRMAARPPAAVAAIKRAVYVGAARTAQRGRIVEAGGLISAGKTRLTARLARRLLDDLERTGRPPFLADPQLWESGTLVRELATDEV
ncbi:enoyl-CoA hydratase/isomerase family protein [Spongisporangium articulatum]|uniref:Enoyl-CoA hydratase/isomerase family protein n=1 Tax=Spongisporangium articulatum TaxID=3362603 RepID=A0ABW8AHT3_9ACTN